MNEKLSVTNTLYLSVRPAVKRTAL